jgi:hypothetical protein
MLDDGDLEPAPEGPHGIDDQLDLETVGIALAKAPSWA